MKYMLSLVHSPGGLSTALPEHMSIRTCAATRAQEKAADAHDVAAVEGDGHVPAGSIDMDAVPKLFPGACIVVVRSSLACLLRVQRL